jgi:AMMECR1 domain-containing protein
LRFPLVTLKAALTARQHAAVRAYVRGLLRWNATLDAWPRATPVPDATPFVALYVGGSLRGCYGADEGPPAERLARAFVLAAGDARFGGSRREERARAAAQVVYLRGARRVEAERVERELEVGREGIALVDAQAHAIVLLPSVARDGRLDVDGFVRTMAEKAKLPRAQWGGAGVFLFRTDEVPVRRDEARTRAGRKRHALDAAAAHLASLVDARGDVTFAIDPRTGKRAARGEMHHGRVAVALRALGEHGGHARAAARARERLAREVRAALGGARVTGWPDRPDVVAGTLALVAMGGVDVRRDLRAWAHAHPELARNPWHAAQTVAALGRDAPLPLWEACARDLDVHPWSPWTAIAARARGDEGVLARCVPALVDSIRRESPHVGGCGVRAVPETALTAVTVEALAPAESVASARAAVRRGRAFLGAWQIPDDVPAALVREAAGAFPASPVVESLRVDVTGHAMLALGGGAPTTE